MCILLINDFYLHHRRQSIFCNENLCNARNVITEPRRKSSINDIQLINEHDLRNFYHSHLSIMNKIRFSLCRNGFEGKHVPNTIS